MKYKEPHESPNVIVKNCCIPHSPLYALLHYTGLLWLQQDLPRHLSLHLHKELSRPN